MHLHRRHQRLDDEHVCLTAIGLELHAETVIAEAGNLGWAKVQLQAPADSHRQFFVGIPTEDDNAVHRWRHDTRRAGGNQRESASHPYICCRRLPRIRLEEELCPLEEGQTLS